MISIRIFIARAVKFFPNQMTNWRWRRRKVRGACRSCIAQNSNVIKLSSGNQIEKGVLLSSRGRCCLANVNPKANPRCKLCGLFRGRSESLTLSFACSRFALKMSLPHIFMSCRDVTHIECCLHGQRALISFRFHFRPDKTNFNASGTEELNNQPMTSIWNPLNYTTHEL